MDKKVSVYRKEHFNAAHRLHNSSWDEERNDAIFGKCNNPSYHGHNYEMEVKVSGVPAEDTGFVIDMKLLSNIINEHVIEKFDHKNLNLDVKEFAEVNPTAENIVILIYDLLREKIDKKFDLQIRLYETPRNFAEYPAS